MALRRRRLTVAMVNVGRNGLCGLFFALEGPAELLDQVRPHFGNDAGAEGADQAEHGQGVEVPSHADNGFDVPRNGSSLSHVLGLSGKTPRIHQDQMFQPFRMLQGVAGAQVAAEAVPQQAHLLQAGPFPPGLDGGHELLFSLFGFAAELGPGTPGESGQVNGVNWPVFGQAHDVVAEERHARGHAVDEHQGRGAGAVAVGSAMAESPRPQSAGGVVDRADLRVPSGRLHFGAFEHALLGLGQQLRRAGDPPQAGKGSVKPSAQRSG